MAGKLTKKQKELVDGTVRQFVRASRKAGFSPSGVEILRAEEEAAALVLSGHITAADLQPTRFDVTECVHQTYDVYQSPREA